VPTESFALFHNSRNSPWGRPPRSAEGNPSNGTSLRTALVRVRPDRLDLGASHGYRDATSLMAAAVNEDVMRSKAISCQPPAFAKEMKAG